MVVRVNIPERIGRPPPAWWRKVGSSWAFLLWVFACLAAFYLYFHGGRMAGMSGVVESDVQDIAPMETGELTELLVEVGQIVKAGDLLARMDTAILEAEMSVEKLQAERQFSAALQRTESELRNARIQQAADLGELEVLDVEVARLDELLARQLVDAQTVARLRSRQRALRRAAELYPDMIEALEKNVETGKKRMADMDRSWSLAEDEDDASPLDAEISRKRMSLLQVRAESYLLRARENGTVSRIDHAEGEVVPEGIPILTIVGLEVKRIVGFLPESNARDVYIGMTAYVTSLSDPRRSVPSKIIAVTPDILALPGRANPVPGRVLRGRRVILVPVEAHDLFAGESVTIRFERPLLSLLFSRAGGRNPPAMAPGGVPSDK